MMWLMWISNISSVRKDFALNSGVNLARINRYIMPTNAKTCFHWTRSFHWECRTHSIYGNLSPICFYLQKDCSSWIVPNFSICLKPRATDTFNRKFVGLIERSTTAVGRFETSTIWLIRSSKSCKTNPIICSAQQKFLPTYPIVFTQIHIGNRENIQQFCWLVQNLLNSQRYVIPITSEQDKQNRISKNRKVTTFGILLWMISDKIASIAIIHRSPLGKCQIKLVDSWTDVNSRRWCLF